MGTTEEPTGSELNRGGRGDGMSEIVIASAARTPIGSFNGAFASVPAHYLGEVAIRGALERSGIEPAEVSEVVMGQILTAGQGQNPARQAAVNADPGRGAGLGRQPAVRLGLRAVALGYQAIRQGDSRIVVAGGQESMSRRRTPPTCAPVRRWAISVADTMIQDGLWDAFHGYHMGNTAENVAEKYQITREQQDEFAVRSQNKAEAAIKSGRFKDEIVPVTLKGRKGDTVVEPTSSRVSARRWRRSPSCAGVRQGGLGHRRQRVGDQRRRRRGGADDRGRGQETRHHAACPDRVLGARRSIPRSWAPGRSPLPARPRARRLVSRDLDLVEASEAFAAQACAVNKDLGWDTDKVNVNGGAIALGHPIGASGTRVFVTLLHEMIKRDAKKGLATLCIGGGMASPWRIARDRISSTWCGHPAGSFHLGRTQKDRRTTTVKAVLLAS